MSFLWRPAWAKWIRLLCLRSSNRRRGMAARSTTRSPLDRHSGSPFVPQCWSVNRPVWFSEFASRDAATGRRPAASRVDLDSEIRCSTPVSLAEAQPWRPHLSGAEDKAMDRGATCRSRASKVRQQIALGSSV